MGKFWLLFLPLIIVTGVKDEKQVPGPPTTIRVQAVGNIIKIHWTAPLDDDIKIRGYTVGWGVGVPDVHQAKIESTARHHIYTIKSLNPSQEYIISLRAFNRMGNGFPVYETVMTQDLTNDTLVVEVEPLPTPIGLQTEVLNSTAIRLSWVDTTLPAKGGPQQPSDGRYYQIK